MHSSGKPLPWPLTTGGIKSLPTYHSLVINSGTQSKRSPIRSKLSLSTSSETMNTYGRYREYPFLMYGRMYLQLHTRYIVHKRLSNSQTLYYTGNRSNKFMFIQTSAFLIRFNWLFVWISQQKSVASERYLILDRDFGLKDLPPPSLRDQSSQFL